MAITGDVSAALKEIRQLQDLIAHMWVHSGYENCGRKQMTTPQKELFDKVIEEETKDL
jgi:hypothetical protein